MRVAVVSDLVAGRHDGADLVRVALGRHAWDEERRVDRRLLEQREDPRQAAPHPYRRSDRLVSRCSNPRPPSGRPASPSTSTLMATGGSRERHEP